MNDKREVASVFDLHIRSLERYEKLRGVFNDDPKGADLILAVFKFRSLYSSYKKNIDPQLLDWLTLLVLSGHNDVLHGKVQAALEAACSAHAFCRPANNVQQHVFVRCSSRYRSSI